MLARLSLSQPQLAQWLRVSQATVHRLAVGTSEPGPISKLLDQLEAVVAERGVEAARAWVLSGASSPEEPEPARPSHLMQSGFGGFS